MGVRSHDFTAEGLPITTFQLRFAGIAAVLVHAGCIFQSPLGAAPVPVKPTETWIDLTAVHTNVTDTKKEIVLDTETAKKIFLKERAIHEDWRKSVPRKIEPAVHAESVPKAVREVWIAEKNPKPQPMISKFSEKEVAVFVVVHSGRYLSSQFYECLAEFRIERNKEIDDLFGLADLDKAYRATHKGLKHGDSAGAVTKLLGEPDAKIIYQLGDYYQVVYFKDDIIVIIDCDRIKLIQFGVPQELKDELKKSGKNYVIRG